MKAAAAVTPLPATDPIVSLDDSFERGFRKWFSGFRNFKVDYRNVAVNVAEARLGTQHRLWLALAILVLVALPAVAKTPPARAAAANAIPLPISAAWFYMADDLAYNQIPAYWSQIDFRDVDVLNVGPAGVQSDGTFGLYNSPQTGDLANRFRWVIQRARAQNPQIKIIVSQWYGEGSGRWGRALSALTSVAAIRRYTDSVYDFLAAYRNTAGGVDGFDIDYESNNVSPSTRDVISQVRVQLSRLSGDSGGRPFYLTVSPATIAFLGGTVGSLDLVNMQTYGGSIGLAPQSFIGLGFRSTQLLYGICPERDCRTPSLAQVQQAYTANRLAGIHLWRLNSDNHVYEGQVQRQVSRFLHGTSAAPATPKTSPPGN